MKNKIEKRIICSKCGKIIQSYMDDAFNPQWSNISPYSGRHEILCDECRPEPPDFAKEDREKKENISKLKNLFNTLLEYYYQSKKSTLNNIDGVVIHMNYEELEKKVSEDRNEFNRLLKQLELE